jgi:flagellar biosynthesis/type III secretory pathway protein FliH
MEKEYPKLPERLTRHNDGVYKTISEAYKFSVEYPDRPKRPFLSNKPGSVAAAKYAEELALYENENAEYLESIKLAREHNRKIDQLIEAFIREESGLNTIPEQYRDKVYRHAYQTGHSSGFSEIYNHLLDLIEIFQ